MLGPDPHLIFPAELVVLGDEPAAVGDVEPSRAARDLDRPTDQGEGHGVAIGLEAHEVILGHAPGLARLEPVAGLARGGDERALLAREAIRGALVGGAVDAHIGDLRLPLAELLAKVLLVDERTPRQEIPFEVLHARFDLALRLRAIGPAEMRLEAPVVGELLESRIPDDPPVTAGLAHCARPVVEMLARVAAEVVEGAFVRVEKLAERLAQTGLVEA